MATDRSLLRAIRAQRRQDAAERKATMTLTKCQQQVLQLIAEDMFAKEIADVLHVTTQTVYFHRQNLKRKFHCCTSAGLVYKAIRMGYLKA